MKFISTLSSMAAALSKAQGAIKGASKDSRNPHFQSRYADLASVWDACRDALAANEIAVVQSPRAEGNIVSMQTILIHSSGEWIESEPLTVTVRDSSPQSIGSGITYLRRYQLSSMVGVAPEDDDAEAAQGRPATVAKRGTKNVEVLEDTPDVRYQKALLRIETASSPETLAKCVDRSSQLHDQGIFTSEQHENLALFATLLRGMMSAETYEAIHEIERRCNHAVSVTALTQAQGDKVTYLGIGRRKAIDAKEKLLTVPIDSGN